MYHQEKHSEIECPQWVHAMNLTANQFLDEVSLTKQSSGLAVNIANEKEVELSEETTIFLWDLDLSIPLDDVFEV